jgi:hypothetical protein
MQFNIKKYTLHFSFTGNLCTFKYSQFIEPRVEGQKVALQCHDWGNNTITIQRTNTVRTIFVNKKLGASTKRLKVFVCYDFHFGISNK